MKAAIVNPYFDSLGGGERYSLLVAQALEKAGYEVDIEWKDKAILKKLKDRFGIDTAKLQVKKDVRKGEGYDLCFWVSDGSIPSFKARKNILHFQVPFTNVNGASLLNKMKLFRVNEIVCNSYFTKRIIDQEYKVKSKVIYPPVGVAKIKPKRKKMMILFVGRFSELVQKKNQAFLIDAFKFFSKRNPEWVLVLAGGTEVGADSFVRKLKRKAKGLKVEIIESPSFKEIVKLYGEAKIFWSAVGYGVNEKKNPEKVEHFGISLVEAMAGATVPVVYKGGGYKEIVENGVDGFLWKNKRELLFLTKKIIERKDLYRDLSRSALKKSRHFSDEVFIKKITELIV